RLSPAVRKLLLAVALARDLREPQLASIVDGALDEAVGAGVLEIEGDRVRAAHPLLAAAARAASLPRERRALHVELAGVVGDEQLRARHLALGTDHPDSGLAARVARASARAAARGATEDAVELAAQAVRLTPDGSAEHAERLLSLADQLVVAGEHERVNELLASVFAEFPSGTARARAYLLLAEVNFRMSHIEDAGAHLQRALAESGGDAGLHAYAAARWANFLAVGRVASVEEAE